MSVGTRPLSSGLGKFRLPGQFVLPLLVPGLIYLSVILGYYQRLRSTLQLPDYGDLWRMSLHYSADGRLQPGEPFIEAEPFSHIPVVHSTLNHWAITSGDYRIFWAVGSVAAVLTGWLIGAGLVALIPNDERRPSTILAATLAGALAFRFDVRNLVTNSLLLESQILFLQGALAIALAGWVAVSRFDRCAVAIPGTQTADSPPGDQGEAIVAPTIRSITAKEWVASGLLLLSLIIGDAPAAVVSVCLIALAVTAGFIARRPLAATFRRLGIVGAAALAIRWSALTIIGSAGRPTPIRDAGIVEIVSGSLKLIGASILNLTASTSPRVVLQINYDRAHVSVAVILVMIWVVTVFRLLRRPEPMRVEVAFAVCLTLAVSFVVVGSVATASVRGVNGAYQVSRAVRNTALAAPATLAAVFYNLRMHRRTAALAGPIVLGAAVALLALRGYAAFNGYKQVDDVVRYRETTATIVCEQPRVEDRWKRLWPGFGPETIDEILASDDLQIADRAGCAE